MKEFNRDEWYKATAEAYERDVGDTGATREEIDAYVLRILKESIDKRMKMLSKVKHKKK